MALEKQVTHEQITAYKEALRSEFLPQTDREIISAIREQIKPNYLVHIVTM